MQQLPSPLSLVLIGANGYVGRAVLQELASQPERFSVRAQVRTPLPDHANIPAGNITMLKGSLEQVNDDLFPQEPHVLIHVAGKNIDHDGTGYHQVNVKGTANLLSHINQHTKAILYNSSLSVLGQGPQTNVSNNRPARPQTPLARSRAEAEALILTRANQLGISAYPLRPRFVLGQEDAFVIPALIKLVTKGLYIGDGHQQFSIIDVADYARVILQLAEFASVATSPEQIPLNIGYRQPLPFASMHDILQQLQPGTVIRRKLPYPAAIARLLNASRIQKLKSLATQLQLIGLDHYGDISETSQRLRTDLLSRDSYEYFRELAQYFKDSPCN